jgi:hypothetical protein
MKTFQSGNLMVGKGGLPPLVSGIQPKRGQAALPNHEMSLLESSSVSEFPCLNND